jgi:DNA repair protein RecN (Recombination protein N)
MLVELHVRGLGVIEDTAIELGPGLTAITGETGAGKTLIVDALDFVLGGKPRRDLVDEGSDAMVEACFVDDEGNETILRREMPADGRARTFIDGRSATASALSELGTSLCDIHGQHEHQSLLGSGAVRDALDTFAGIDTHELNDARSQLRGLEERRLRQGGDLGALERELALLEHEVRELDGAAIRDAGELDEILEELSALDSAQEIQRAITDLLGLVEATDETSASHLLRSARNQLGTFKHLSEATEGVVAAELAIEEMGSSLRQAMEAIDADPQRRQDLEQRASTLHALIRRFGPTLTDVLERLEEKRQRVAELEDLRAGAARLDEDMDGALERLHSAEAIVLELRRAASPALAQEIMVHLGDLALTGAQVVIECSGAAGDDTALLFSANLGHEPRPLGRVASGGELARLMLAINLAITSGPPTMVFDEVDAGVGGATALALGRALHALASSRQVLVVTHLAQVAAQAARHVSIVKQSSNQRTIAKAELLEGEARVLEIARMLAGDSASQTALQHARELLAQEPITTDQLRLV